MKTTPPTLPLFAAATTTRTLVVRTDVRAGAMERRCKNKEELSK